MQDRLGLGSRRQRVSTVGDGEGMLKAVFDPPIEGYVFEFDGRGSGEYGAASGLVVVNAVTGEVEAADFMEYNP